MTPAVKKSIFDFVSANLPSQFVNKVYWRNERKKEPKMPFCLLSAIIPEQDTNFYTETETIVDDLTKDNVSTLKTYKECVITISIFVDGTTDGSDLDVQNEFASDTARNLSNLFKFMDTAWSFNVDGISVNEISSIRDLTTVADGGYNFRYEFDIAFGYNEDVAIQKPKGKNVNLQIERKDI